METYIIKYLLIRNDTEKNTIVSVTMDLKDDKQAVQICKDFQSKGNFIQEIYNKTNNKTVYHYKKAKFQHVLTDKKIG